ncbi:type III pantothenate kinase [Bordetella holmesii]|uniref:Type III pantothenate kinase n=2 Tax=Bordetella holmesii TaxID=35814 RepID=A0A158M165_9BORD|nr:type III pantothenate kinase [Bordetella holmesii]AHV91188.1 type III pantothenate kinase family protein [Bordetella holmesii ATCC 51541]AIT25961.1 type III pantothenate kinase family protein [Bordetella holmesii 44057]EWM44448.1 type III pantothenate kinase family protein [Bordetella holmesii 41130]EWM50697.1 type III pantothenate kinase family protein [Bordetella holmesii 70147]AMD45054.1 type III pantothenate kinase [Bordetella holmesii H558]
MILLIDSGNSRLKLGWLHLDSGAREPEPVAFDNLDLQALGAWLQTLRHKPVRAIGVNVAGAQRGAAIAAAMKGCAIEWKRPQRDVLGMTNAYRHQDQLGADRWAAMLGLHMRLPAGHPPALLASFGTATTLDTLGPDNEFAGGLILPGPAMMRGSLVHGTANLPLAEGPVTPYPTETHEAIATGIAAAQAGALVRQWLAGHARYGKAPEVYVAGGGWTEVQPEIERLLRLVGASLGAVSTPTFLKAPVLDGLAALAAATAAH